MNWITLYYCTRAKTASERCFNVIKSTWQTLSLIKPKVHPSKRPKLSLKSGNKKILQWTIHLILNEILFIEPPKLFKTSSSMNLSFFHQLLTSWKPKFGYNSISERPTNSCFLKLTIPCSRYSLSPVIELFDLVRQRFQFEHLHACIFFAEILLNFKTLIQDINGF